MNETSQVATWQNASAAIATAVNTLLWDSNATLYRDNETTTLHPQDGNVWAILSGIASPSQASSISAALAARWTPYGAPAPEAGTTISPFITGFELQAQFLAGQPQRAIKLMQFMWADFMLDDPRMTNSTFIEGYDTSGALHYPAYADDARISHAHGWSTGPVLALSNFAAGLHVLDPGTWVAHPQPGDLSHVEAGFKVAHGEYSAKYTVTGTGARYEFSTPVGTEGSLVVDGVGCDASVVVSSASNSTGSKGEHGNGKHGNGNGKKNKGFSWRKHIKGHKGASSAKPWSCGVLGPKTGASDANGTVTVDGLQGGSYVVEITCT